MLDGVQCLQHRGFRQTGRKEYDNEEKTGEFSERGVHQGFGMAFADPVHGDVPADGNGWNTQGGPVFLEGNTAWGVTMPQHFLGGLIVQELNPKRAG